MLVIRVKMQVAPENKAVLINTMKEDIAVSQAFDGCIQFNVYQDVTDDNAILLYEEWESQAQFDTYRESEHFKQVGQKLFPLMDGKPDSAYFSVQTIQ